MLSCRLVPSDSVFFSDLISFFWGGGEQFQGEAL